ncbi:Receptor expression-enhancing protein 5 [Podochytrium sp. JEL0797]|nr:Receptor expression-enhancing protein 5 [Podochytrium sp. JEL0797]
MSALPPPYTKWAGPPKKPEPPKPKPPPGLLSVVPQLLKDGKVKYGLLDKALVAVPGIMELAHVTKLPHAQVLVYILSGITYIAFVFLNLAGSGGILTHALALGWPVIQSLRAAESLKKDEVQTWLSYWVIVSILALLEQIGIGRMPFYYFIKMVFVLWLIIPYSNGSLVIYNLVLKKILPPIKKPAPPKKPDSKWAY